MAFRILTQVNFSAGENPEGDSGLYFIRDLIHAIIELDNNFHFYVLIPNKCKEIWSDKFNFDRVTMIPIDIGQRSHGGDFQFNPDQILESFKFRKYEVDCLFLNQPELVNAYLHLFNKLLFHNIPAISYLHWFDVRRVSSKNDINKPVLLSSLSGMLVSTLVGCNSNYGKTQIIHEAENWFNSTCTNELINKIEVLPPGINTEEIDKYEEKKAINSKKKILVNHRLLKYTGVRNLLTEVFPKLWETRDDFVVIVTNPSKVRLPLKIKNVPWLINGNYSREQYLKLLWECDIVVSPHKDTHWSISTLEALYAGCVPLLSLGSFFGELMNPIITDVEEKTKEHISSHWFVSKNNLIQKLNYVLDNIMQEKLIAISLRDNIRTSYNWKIIAKKWIDIFYSIDSKTNSIAHTNPSFNKIVQMVNITGSISKEAILRNLNWGPQSRTLSWSAFRNSLKDYFVDDSLQSEVVYQVRQKS